MITLWQILKEDGTKEWVPAVDVKMGMHQRAVVLRHGRDRGALMDDIKPLPPASNLFSQHCIHKLSEIAKVFGIPVMTLSHGKSRTGQAKLMADSVLHISKLAPPEEYPHHVTVTAFKQRTVPKP